VSQKNVAAAVWFLAADLIPWDRNPKAHPTDNVAAIARSIKRFGFAAPIVAWQSRRQIVAGHGRLLAAQLLYREDPGQLLATDQPGPGLVPVRFLEFASDAEAAALAIADNRLTEANPMDDAIVSELLRELKAGGVAVDGLGYSDADLDELMNPPNDTPEPEDAEVEGDGDAQGEPDSRLGEVYELGPHRLVCGDSGDPLAVDKVMRGEFADATLTDPPYGQDQPGVTNDAPELLDGILQRCASIMPMKNGVCVAFSSPRTFTVWLDIIRDVGHKFERMLWLYKEAQNSYPWRGWLLTSEAILATSIGEGKWQDVHPYKHDCYKLSEVSGELPSDIGWHGSVKPLSVVTDILTRIAPPGALVYEPFGGSGTTLIACAQTGRKARLIEIDPRYCDVIRRRWTRWAKEAGVNPGSGSLE